MVSMFIEAGDLFGCQPPPEGEDEIVVGQLSFNLPMRDADFSFERIDVSDFGFDEVDSPTQHGVAQIKSDVLFLAFTKSQPYQRGIENKLPAARHQRDLVFVAEFFSKTLRGYYAAEPATQY